MNLDMVVESLVGLLVCFVSICCCCDMTRVRMIVQCLQVFVRDLLVESNMYRMSVNLGVVVENLCVISVYPVSMCRCKYVAM